MFWILHFVCFFECLCLVFLLFVPIHIFILGLTRIVNQKKYILPMYNTIGSRWIEDLKLFLYLNLYYTDKLLFVLRHSFCYIVSVFKQQ